MGPAPSSPTRNSLVDGPPSVRTLGPRICMCMACTQSKGSAVLPITARGCQGMPAINGGPPLRASSVCQAVHPPAPCCWQWLSASHCPGGRQRSAGRTVLVHGAATWPQGTQPHVACRQPQTHRSPSSTSTTAQTAPLRQPGLHIKSIRGEREQEQEGGVQYGRQQIKQQQQQQRRHLWRTWVFDEQTPRVHVGQNVVHGPLDTGCQGIHHGHAGQIADGGVSVPGPSPCPRLHSVCGDDEQRGGVAGGEGGPEAVRTLHAWPLMGHL